MPIGVASKGEGHPIAFREPVQLGARTRLESHRHRRHEAGNRLVRNVHEGPTRTEGTNDAVGGIAASLRQARMGSGRGGVGHGKAWPEREHDDQEGSELHAR